MFLYVTPVKFIQMSFTIISTVYISKIIVYLGDWLLNVIDSTMSTG